MAKRYGDEEDDLFYKNIDDFFSSRIKDEFTDLKDFLGSHGVNEKMSSTIIDALKSDGTDASVIDRLKSVISAVKDSKFNPWDYIDFFSNLVNSLGNKIRSTTDPLISSYEQTIEKLAYGLVGTATSTKDVIDTLQTTLSTTGIVNMQSVYGKLTRVIESGILSDSYTRAFLEQLGDDIGSQYSGYVTMSDEMLRLFKTDIFDEEMAMESALKSFLNNHYENSQYMMQEFSKVATSLETAISMSSSRNGVESGISLESTIQKWMGSLYSNGASDTFVSNLTTALNQLGSGDVDVTNSAINKLIIAAANNAGLNYGDMLNQGASADDVNKLMQSIVYYVGEMSDDSNIVMSRLSKVFGIAVTDIQAMNNLIEEENVQLVAETQITTDIGENVLKKMGDYVNTYNWWSNLIGNMKYTYATEMVDTDWEQIIYSVGGAISKISNDALVTAVTEALGIGPIVKAIGAVSNVAELLIGGVETIGDFSQSNFTNASKIYEKLAGIQGTSTGNIDLTDSSDNSTSYSAELSTASSKLESSSSSSTTSSDSSDSSNITGYNSSVSDAALQDIYNLLYKFPNYQWSTVASINDTANMVKVNTDQYGDIEEYTVATAVYTKNIYELLAQHFEASSSVTIEEGTKAGFGTMVSSLKHNLSTVI